MKPLGLAVMAFFLLGAAQVFAGPVDINTADAPTLAAELTGIGPVLAAEIVRDREQNGRYDTPEALMRVKGVGQRVVDMNRANILIGASPDQ